MRIPKSIIEAADKIIAKSIEEGNNSKILRSKYLIVQILNRRYNGNNSENGIANALGIDRMSVNRIIKRGVKNPKSAAGIFAKYWFRLFEEAEEIMLNQLTKRGIDVKTPTKEKIEILRFQRPYKYQYDPTGKSHQGNQTLQITNNYYSPEVLKAVQSIIDLPKEQRKLAFEELNEIIIEPDLEIINEKT